MSLALIALASIAAAPAAPADSALGWGAADLPLLLGLPLLMMMSGFVSGSETALFGLSHDQRLRLHALGSIGGRAVDALLAEPRMLLVTVLLANTTINVLYFVTTSVLLMRADVNPYVAALLGVGFLLGIVLAGEVIPKTLAEAHRERFALVCAPPLRTFHALIAPLRIVLAEGVIAPLGRLITPHLADAGVDDEELRLLLDVSQQRGVIDDEEQRMIRETLELRRLKVRDVMTPRVRMTALPTTATREDVERIVREERLLVIPVYDGDLDTIVGFLHAKRCLGREGEFSATDPRILTPPRFVPDIASLDQLLDRFRDWHARTAIVVDEYGGTEGIVRVEDVVEEIVGDIAVGGSTAAAEPRLVGLGRWEVDAGWPIRDFVAAFGARVGSTEFATLSGLIADRLGRAPRRGDEIEVDGIRLRVRRVEGKRAAAIEIREARREPDPPPAPEEAP